MSRKLHVVAFTLLVIGGLNWLFIGLWNMNLVTKIFGSGTLTMVIYILVGLSAIHEIAMHKKQCKYCSEKSGM